MLWLGIAIGVKTSACAQQVSWKQMTIRFTLFKVILSISSCAFNDEFIAERKKSVKFIGDHIDCIEVENKLFYGVNEVLI